MGKSPAVAAAPAAQQEQHPPKWRRRSLVRVRRPSWASADSQPRKSLS
jgi:hypothetical protein